MNMRKIILGIKRYIGIFMKKASKFYRNISGNFAILTAVAFVPVAFMIGGAVDVFQFTTTKTTLQNATEAAALAAASLNNKQNANLEQIANEYVVANLPEGDFFSNVVTNVNAVTISSSEREIEITASLDLDLPFFRFIGIKDSIATAESTAIQAETGFEIALSLDISLSMDGDRIAALEEATKDFIELILKGQANTSISLIPFGGSVNVGSQLFNEYAYENSNAIVDPSQSQYFIEENVPFNAFRFSEGDNCLEYTQDDFSDELLAANSHSQLPNFTAFRLRGPWCPVSDSEIMLNSNDAAALSQRVATMGNQLSAGTATDIGALWGAKVLSPKWRGKLGGDFPNRPAEYDDTSITKIFILMADGGVTEQIRPQSTITSSNVQLNNGSRPRQTIVEEGNLTDPASDNTAFGHLKKTCDEMAGNGVRIYAIGFKITNTEDITTLQNCVANGGAYFSVQSLDLAQAFEAIRTSISALRISG
ncbi:MAG: pilus assembly protein TadG-related protein [Hyphomicrobiales bacterium]